MDLEGIYSLFHQNKMQMALDHLRKSDITNQNKLQYISIEMKILNGMQKYDQCISLGAKIWNSEVNSEYEFLIAINYIEAIISLGKIKDAREKFEILKHNMSSVKDKIPKYILFWFYYQKATLHLKFGELAEALEITELNQDLINNMPVIHKTNLIGIIHLRLGLILDYMGKLKAATEFYHKSEEEFKNYPNKTYLMRSYQNLGNIYRLRGLIDKSLEYFTLSEKLSQKLDDTIQMAQMSIERGVNYLIKGMIPETLEKYQYAEDILKDTGPLDSFFIYASYFELYSDLQDYQKAKHYFEILEKNDIYQESAYYSIHMQFYSGLLLKLSKSTRNKALAMNIFEKIANETIVDHTVTFQALIHYLDMLITDLIDTEDETIFEEIKNQIKKIEKFANNEDISDLRAKSYLFKSKIALIEGNFGESEGFLLKAKDIADEYGYISLSIRISNEYDELFRLVNKQVISGNTGINDYRERLVNSKFNHLITEYSLSKPRVAEIGESIPIHLFVTKFDDEEVFEVSLAKNYDDDFDSLRNNIRTLISSVKTPENTIDRLNFNEYIITTSTDGNWLTCMIFKGSSYQIGKYLDQIMTILIENRDKDLTMTKIQDTSLSVIQNYHGWSN